MRKEPNQHLIDETIAVWQSPSPAPLTPEDARDILANTASLFQLLIEWEEREVNVADPSQSQATGLG